MYEKITYFLDSQDKKKILPRKIQHKTSKILFKNYMLITANNV